MTPHSSAIDATEIPLSPPLDLAQKKVAKAVSWKEDLVADLSAHASPAADDQHPQPAQPHPPPQQSVSQSTHAHLTARSRPSSASSTSSVSTSSSGFKRQVSNPVGGPAPAHLGLPVVVWSSGPTPIPRLRFQAVDFLINQRQAAKLPLNPLLRKLSGQPGSSIQQLADAATSQSPSPDLSDASPPQHHVLMKLSYRIVGSCECQLIRSTLAAHGWREAGSTQGDFNLLWSNGKVEPHEMRLLNRYQKVNRFPRTNEITRKDKLHINISRMRQTYGDRHFDFIPPTFLLPQEYETFYTCYLRIGGRWIVKPVGSAHARDSKIIDSLAELPTRLNIDDRFLIQRYIESPFLIEGRKFDVRIYVAVTSFSPLRIYMFEEGLVKFCKEGAAHDQSTGSSCGSQEQEDSWSLTALIRYITCKFGADSASMIMAKIKDIIVKSFLSGEAIVSTAVNMFVQHSENCFELLGFDILLDQSLTPWLLDINLSPSLACETALDLKIKSALVADIFTLIGIIPFEKNIRRGQHAINSQPKPYRAPPGYQPTASQHQKTEWSSTPQELQKLTPEQQKLIRLTRDEAVRAGAFTRIFPSDSSAYLYSSFIPKSSINWTVLIALYGRTSLARPKRENLSGPQASSVRSSSTAPRFSSLAYMVEDTEHTASRRAIAVGVKGVGKDTSSSAPWAVAEQVELAMEAEAERSSNSSNSNLSVSQHIRSLETQMQRQNMLLRGTASNCNNTTTSTFTFVSPTATATAITTTPAPAPSSKSNSHTAPAAESNSPRVATSPNQQGGRGDGAFFSYETGAGSSSSSIKASGFSSKRLAEKIQAREAFHVFLENILFRLRKHYEQSDPSSESDMSYIRQQVAVIDKFLMQAKELSIDSDHQQQLSVIFNSLLTHATKRPLIMDPQNISDMPALTERLDKFIKSYRRQTDKFKNECLANGKISGSPAYWTTTQSSTASSSRQSSRPNSASKSGRADSAKNHQQPPQANISVPPSQQLKDRGWADPVLATKASSAFPVAYAWSSSLLDKRVGGSGRINSAIRKGVTGGGLTLTAKKSGAESLAIRGSRYRAS